MSLDKQGEARRKWIEANMPAESMDPPFPYIALTFVREVGSFKSPVGFKPLYYQAHSSIAGLPESLRIDL